MPQLFKIAIVQKKRDSYNAALNTAQGINIIKESKRRGADIVLFPECWITGYRFPNIDSSLPLEKIVQLICKVEYDEAFISDDLKSYKGDKNGKFFRTVLGHLDAAPKEIIHIGDSSADVLGAHRAGITSCWINRNDREWSNPIMPDFIIRDFNDLMDIL